MELWKTENSTSVSTAWLLFFPRWLGALSFKEIPVTVVPHTSWAPTMHFCVSKTVLTTAGTACVWGHPEEITSAVKFLWIFHPGGSILPLSLQENLAAFWSSSFGFGFPVPGVMHSCPFCLGKVQAAFCVPPKPGWGPAAELSALPATSVAIPPRGDVARQWVPSGM